MNIQQQMHIQHRYENEKRGSIMLTWWFFGLFGIHRFKTGHWGTGLLYLCTFGLCGFGYLFDMFLLNSLVKDANKRLYKRITIDVMKQEVLA